MRGGLERWKRGASSGGVRQVISYALEGTCDAHLRHPAGAEALETYSAASDSTVTRFIVASGRIGQDELTAGGLRVWLTGHDPISGEERGRQRLSPDADLLLDGTLNHPKTYSIAALLNPDLAAEFEALQDRLRDRILLTWQTGLNARRGHGGLIREDIARIEFVELQHSRSRALDPHNHRHLWLNVKVLGVDGKWSNLDSRAAIKMHTVINAEGEFAARTDPGCSSSDSGLRSKYSLHGQDTSGSQLRSGSTLESTCEVVAPRRMSVATSSSRFSMERFRDGTKVAP